ncbi:MAG: iron-sulfur protein, partial [Phycisphaerae bacterium]|nr:iron-sulfur protein [Phycisphaerae bacterium]NIS54329.1 iron-sulfur protein [Phycisphaerae bacterium]
MTKKNGRATALFLIFLITAGFLIGGCGGGGGGSGSGDSGSGSVA